MRELIKSLFISFLLILFMAVLTGCERGPHSAGVGLASQAQPVDDVNPFVGTAAGGNTFPGATMPFGMIQWSPASGVTDHAGGYVYSDSVMRGFSLNHLDGQGCTIMGDVPIMPWVGTVAASPAVDQKAYLAKFSHADEQASPGFYAVGLGNGVHVELTVTTRAGIGRFTFPSSTDSNVLFETSHDANAFGVSRATVGIAGTQKISGSVATSGFCSYPNKYTVYFAAEFNRPFTRFGTWTGSVVRDGRRFVSGRRAGGFVGFDTRKNPVVELKVALSYVSVANAWKNLDQEIPGWDFDAVKKAAHKKWNNELGLVAVSGGSNEERRVFYTALYHVLQDPTVFSDVNGEYMGFDDRVHVAKGYMQYANYSGWDIYRDEIQLLALLHPRETSDMIQSLVEDAEQGGGLPKWPVANHEACQMVGNPACPIIADAYAFGAREFDAQAALKAMLKGATQPGAKCNACPEWDSLENYLKHGYLGPDDSGQRKGSHSGPSQTLEFTTADFSIAQMAKALGDTATYQTFMRRAQFWRNTFDAKTGYIAPRRNNSSFIPVDPGSPKFYVEGNAAQYSWMVPYNMETLVKLMGGDAAVVKRLNTFFTELNVESDKPYMDIGNEPTFDVPWAYDFVGAPWGAQEVCRRIETTGLFTSKPDGLPGNDDLGAMSSWYVFAALGFYPAIPGVGGVALDSPLFPKAILHLGNGHEVIIEGENAAAATPYVQNLSINGKPYARTWIPYETLEKGATLRFRLGATPNRKWGSKPDDAPPSFTEGMAASRN